MNIVISQPFFLPWVGVFEQLRLADVFVHYDDVQMSGKGNFINRVQVKTKYGIKWLTVPVKHIKSVAQKINEVKIRDDLGWKKDHQSLIYDSYKAAPYFAEVELLIKELYANGQSNLSDFNIGCLERITRYFGFSPRFCRSSDLAIESNSSQRVVAICKHFNATKYITGLGALKYIDYDLFETNGIALEYMDYQKTPYPQLHGEFTPYVSILDLIANCGKEGEKYINSESVYWKDFIDGQNQ